MRPKPHSHKERARLFQMPVCIYHTRELHISPSTDRCSFRCLCPVATLSIFLASFCSGWAYIYIQKRKPLACLFPCMNCQSSSCFLLVQSLFTPLATFTGIPSAGSGLINECEEPCLADPSAISFPSIPIYLVTHTSWTLSSSASFTRD